MEEIIIYTDGGCSGNPGPGGWGTVVIADGKETRLSGGEKNTTNNRMELMAAISALEFALNNFDVSQKKFNIFSDSQYVKNGITSWIKNWKKNGWRTAAKKPVLNQDLWIRLDAAYSQIPNLDWNWVKGHAGVEYNEICDQLAGKKKKKMKSL